MLITWIKKNQASKVLPCILSMQNEMTVRFIRPTNLNNFLQTDLYLNGIMISNSTVRLNEYDKQTCTTLGGSRQSPDQTAASVYLQCGTKADRKHSP